MTGETIKKVKELMEIKVSNQKAREQDILMQIAAIAGVEFANLAKRELSSEKHPYTIERYLYLLEILKAAILAGIEPMAALECMAKETGATRLQILMSLLGQ